MAIFNVIWGRVEVFPFSRLFTSLAERLRRGAAGARLLSCSASSAICRSC